MTVTKIFVQKKQLALGGVDVMTHTMTADFSKKIWE